MMNNEKSKIQEEREAERPKERQEQKKGKKTKD